MLLLKRHLIDLVRAGKKRQTIRLWKSRRLRPGQISFTPGLGKMRITAVDTLPSLAALTKADATADGFPSKKSLLAEIHAIYGTPLPKNRQIFRIQFQWPLPDTTNTPETPPHLAPPPKTRPKAAPRRKTNPTPKTQIPKPLPAHPQKTTSQKARQTLHHFILSRAPH